jgi:hypothetical protein
MQMMAFDFRSQRSINQQGCDVEFGENAEDHARQMQIWAESLR